MDFVDLIRYSENPGGNAQSKLSCEYIKPFDPNWKDNEILENIVELFSSSRLGFIKKIPSMLNLMYFYCAHNQIEEIEYMPKLRTLYCGFNNIKKISAPNLEQLSCFNNQLNKLEFMPNLIILNCDTNLLPYSDLNGYKKYYCNKFKDTLDKILISDLSVIVLKYIITS